MPRRAADSSEVASAEFTKKRNNAKQRGLLGVAVVTGANTGMGRFTAEKLCAEGYEVRAVQVEQHITG